jgi:ATP-dependent metalloprotease
MGGVFAASGAAVQQDLGTAQAPVHVTQADPSFRAQFWRTVRSLGLAFIVISGIGALMEDKGVPSRFMSGGGDGVKPVMDSDTKFEDVKGVDEAKEELVEIVEYLKGPERFTRLGGKLPKGVLLVGPPGTGKTMLARAIAGEAGVPFFYAAGSEFEEMFVGVGARRIRDLFNAAKKHSPCIIFIDEIDAVGGKRSPKDQQYMKMTLNQLLVEMDGFKQSQGVIVVGATNFPQSLDKALTRPGRFDRHEVVPNPDVEGRRQILESHFKNIPRADDVDLSIIARGSPGFSGADLANLVNIAALKAAVDQAAAVTMSALEYAKDRIMMGTERKSAVISEENRRLTAYHEGGHALVALFTDGALPIHKATIVPRGPALGMVMQLPEKDQTSISRKQLLARLDVAMGGRVAEELIFGEAEVTTGASSDLQHATRLARDMVTKYGMSKKVGNIAHDYEENQGLIISSETRQMIEDETRVLVEDAYKRAEDLVKKHEKELHALAKALLTQETLSGRAIKRLLGLAEEKVATTAPKLPKKGGAKIAV